MKLRTFLTLIAAFLGGTAILYPLPSAAGSCCGGGGGASLLLPRIYQGMIDVSVDSELYNGYWDLNGKVKPDPPGIRPATVPVEHRICQTSCGAVAGKY